MHKNSRVLFSMLLFLCVVLSGCGAKGSKLQAETTTICIDKDGTVTHQIVETFESEYYDVDSLTTMIEEEIKEYNSGKETASVLLDSVLETENDNGTKQVKVVMTYKNAKEYENFNQKTLFYGTISEALELGYDLDVSLVDLNDETKRIGKSEIEAMKESYLVICEEDVPISLEKKIVYMSNNRKIENKYLAGNSSTMENTYIIIK